MARTKGPTPSLAELHAEIERLKEQAEAIRAAEIAEVVANIKTAIAEYGLTAQDLGLGARRGRPAGKRVAGVIKYADKNGNTWTGRGTRPRWFKDALAKGVKPEDLLVK